MLRSLSWRHRLQLVVGVLCLCGISWNVMLYTRHLAWTRQVFGSSHVSSGQADDLAQAHPHGMDGQQQRIDREGADEYDDKDEDEDDEDDQEAEKPMKPMDMIPVATETRTKQQVWIREKPTNTPTEDKAKASPELPKKGIILCLHDQIVPMGVSLIRELRCLGNQEPIQVFHCFPQELSAKSRRLLTRNDPGVEIIDICSRLVKQKVFTRELAKSFQSYWIKPLAVYHTNLTELILLDADAILMTDPAILRNLDGYLRTGTVFFYDRVINKNRYFNKKVAIRSSSDRVQYLHVWLERFEYARFNISGGNKPSTQLEQSFAFRELTCYEQDSSMVVINKAKAGQAMEVLQHLITEKRFKYTFSWGDKESFWLAYEFAHQAYFFSPWGASVVASSPNKDVVKHPQTLCGNLAHFMPDPTTENAELLYINGKALLEPFPLGIKKSQQARENRLYNVNPTHVTPRQKRSSVGTPEQGKIWQECLTGLGSTPLPDQFYRMLLRRRLHFMAVNMGYYEALDHCQVF